MFYPKIQSLLKNYIGFYLGCILWAIYIKSLGEKTIIGNLCYGGKYSETETLEEVRFIKNYIEKLKKMPNIILDKILLLMKNGLKYLMPIKNF